MILSFTKDLANELSLSSQSELPKNYNPDFFWYGEVRQTDREEDILVLVNEKSRFIVVIPNIYEQDEIEKVITDQIKNTLEKINLDKELIEYYIEQAPNMVVSTVSNKRIKNWLKTQSNEVLSRINILEANDKPIDLADIGANVSILPQRRGYDINKPFIPRCNMYKELTLLKDPDTYINDIENIYEIECSLVGCCVPCSRTILIKGDKSFDDLSAILRKLFNFSSWHLENFEVYDKNRKRHPNLTINSDDDIEGEDSKMTKLVEYFKTAHHIDYIYDFGENWRIRLKLKCACPSYNDPCNFLPYLLSFEGPYPVEDIGGISVLNDIITYIEENPEVLDNFKTEDDLYANEDDDETMESIRYYQFEQIIPHKNIPTLVPDVLIGEN